MREKKSQEIHIKKVDIKNPSFPISKLYNYNGNTRLFEIVQSNKRDSLDTQTSIRLNLKAALIRDYNFRDR